MAKAKSSGRTGSQKISLNVKKKGSAKKKFGPKDSRPKTYVGQGR
jgi:hypothetical protein